MTRLIVSVLAFALVLGGAAKATTFTFASDPFAGSTAPTTPGRQVVGGEPSITFLTGSDLFLIDPTFFAITGLSFASGPASAIPASGVNVIVLQTLDDDNDAATPFGAGSAANLIAAQITSGGAGFFIYFNSALNLPRLVFSTNLDDPTADLKILVRMTNLTGQPDGLAGFTADNFAITPVPPAALLMLTPLVMGGFGVAFKRWRKPASA